MSYSNFHTRRMSVALQYVSDVLRYRHLCWNLVGSDLRSRFRRSRLGILWAVIQPLAFALMIAWVWRQLFDVESFWTYAIYVYSGMLVWEYFGTTVAAAQDALINAQGYIRQARIPFFIFQIRVPLTGLVILGAGTLGLFGLMAALHHLPQLGWHLMLIPAYPVLLLAFCMPLAICLSYLGAQFRDLKYISTLAVQALFFVSPVMIQRDLLDAESLRILHFLNPIISLIDCFRDPILNGRGWDSQDLAVLGVWSGLLWVAAVAISASFGRRIVFAL